MFQVITFAHVLQYLQQFITAHKSLQITKCTLLGPRAMYFPPRPVDSAIQLPLVPRPSSNPLHYRYYLSYRMLCWSNIVLCFSSFQNTTVHGQCTFYHLSVPHGSRINNSHHTAQCMDDAFALLVKLKSSLAKMH